jgi:hypothetical protein
LKILQPIAAHAALRLIQDVSSSSACGDTSPSTIDVIADFEGAGIAGGASGVQLPIALVGDGFVDVSWKHNASSNRVDVWVDANDDGQLSEVDMLICLNAISTFTSKDLVDSFPVCRGIQVADVYVGNASANTAYGHGSNGSAG